MSGPGPAGSPAQPPPPPDTARPPNEVAVGARERSLLLPEIDALLARLSDEGMRSGYLALREQVASGLVGVETEPHLERLLELGLQTGRFRRQYGAIDAQALNRLYGRTARGQDVAAALAAVNAALAALDGLTLDHIALTAKMPGEYDLVVDTAGQHMTIALGPDGVRVVSVETGL